MKWGDQVTQYGPLALGGNVAAAVPHLQPVSGTGGLRRLSGLQDRGAPQQGPSVGLGEGQEKGMACVSQFSAEVCHSVTGVCCHPGGGRRRVGDL